MSEKQYCLMSRVGGGSIAIGVILITTGIVTGVISIVNGAKLLTGKKNMTF